MLRSDLELVVKAYLVKAEFDRAFVAHGRALALLVEAELVDVGRVEGD